MKLAELFVDITARDSQFRASMGRVRSGAEKAKQSLEQLGAAARKVFLVAAAGGTAVTLAFGSFEQQMARVNALSRATADEFERLNRTARELGKSTVFSANQAAQAMGEFALQGFRANEIIGAMPPTLNLAAAGQLAMGQAAQVTAGIMRGMKLDVSELTRVVDVLAAAATSSATDIPELGEAMRQLGPVGAAAGAEIEELVAVIRVFSDVMIRGAAAGTALRNIFLRLQIQPTEVKKALKDLGVEIGDSQGRMRSLADIVDDLNKGMADYTQVQRNATIAQIAGLRAAAAFTELLGKGGDVIREYTTQLENSEGTAKRIADIQSSTLFGSFKLLTSAASELGIVLGEKLAPIIRSLSETFTGMATWIANLDRQIIQFMVVLGAFVGALSLLGIAIAAIGVLIATGFLTPIGAAVAFLLRFAAAVAAANVALGRSDEALKNHTKALDAEQTETRKLVVELGKLLDKQSLTNAEQDRANEIVKTLQKQYGGLGIEVDDLGDALSIAADTMDRLNDAMEKERSLSLSKDIDEITEKLEALRIEALEIIEFDPLLSLVFTGPAGRDVEKLDKLKQVIIELGERREALQRDLESSGSSGGGAINQVGGGDGETTQQVEKVTAAQKKIGASWREILFEMHLATLDAVEKRIALAEREAEARIIIADKALADDQEFADAKLAIEKALVDQVDGIRKAAANREAAQKDFEKSRANSKRERNQRDEEREEAEKERAATTIAEKVARAQEIIIGATQGRIAAMTARIKRRFQEEVKGIEDIAARETIAKAFAIQLAGARLPDFRPTISSTLGFVANLQAAAGTREDPVQKEILAAQKELVKAAKDDKALAEKRNEILANLNAGVQVV